MKLYKFFFTALLILAFIGCKSQPAVTGNTAGSGGGGSGDIVVTGSPALLNLDFNDPGKPVPFTINEHSNLAGCLIDYQDGKLRITNKMAGSPYWIQTDPILGRELQDFFWQFEYTPQQTTWESNWFSFRVHGGDINQTYHLHFICQNGLDMRDQANVAKNNDNVQVHVVTGPQREALVASTRLAWYGAGRPIMIRIVGEDDNCKIWVWRKGRELPEKPTFNFEMDSPGLNKGDFMIVSWDSEFLLDDMVLFDRAKP